MLYKKIIILFLFLTLASCSKNNQDLSENIIQNDNLEVGMIKSYKEGVEALNTYSLEDTISFIQGYNSNNKKIKVEYDVDSCRITSLYII